MSHDSSPHQDIFQLIRNNDSYSTTLKLYVDMYNKKANELLKQDTAIQYIQTVIDQIQRLDPRTCSASEFIHCRVLIESAKIALHSTLAEKVSGDLIRAEQSLNQKIDEFIKDQKRNAEEQRKAELEKKLEQERQAEQKRKEEQVKKEAETAKKAAELAAAAELKEKTESAKGIDLHILTALPGNTKDYANSYILVGKELHYVKSDGTLESNILKNTSELMNLANMSQGAGNRKINLKNEQVLELITKKGGHTPQNQQEITNKSPTLKK